MVPPPWQQAETDDERRQERWCGGGRPFLRSAESRAAVPAEHRGTHLGAAPRARAIRRGPDQHRSGSKRGEDDHLPCLLVVSEQARIGCLSEHPTSQRT